MVTPYTNRIEKIMILKNMNGKNHINQILLELLEEAYYPNKNRDATIKSTKLEKLKKSLYLFVYHYFL